MVDPLMDWMYKQAQSTDKLIITNNEIDLEINILAILEKNYELLKLFHSITLQITAAVKLPP